MFPIVIALSGLCREMVTVRAPSVHDVLALALHPEARLPQRTHRFLVVHARQVGHA